MPAICKPFYSIIFFVLLLPLAGKAQLIPTMPAWAIAMSGQSKTCVPIDMQVDQDNNVYMTGVFTGKIDFDPSPSAKILEAADMEDVFVAKYTSAGALIWAVAFGGGGSDIATGLSVIPGGQVTVTGRFDKTMEVDPGPGYEYLNNTAGKPHAFTVSLDNDGRFLWGKSIDGTGTSAGEKTCINRNGWRTTAGWFQTEAVLNATTTLTNTSGYSGLLATYDTNGNVVWYIQLGQTGDNSLHDIERCATNNVVVTGTFTGTVDFDPRGAGFNLPAPGPVASFVAKYNTAGRLQWVQPIQGNTLSYVSVDPVSDAVYVTGAMTLATVTFAPGQTLTTTHPQDMFIAKYNADGSFAWARCIGGNSGSITAQNISVKNDEVYVTGQFTGSVDFDATAATDIRTYHSQQDIFIVKYDAAGNYKWAGNVGAFLCSNVKAGGIGVDTNGHILLAGSFCEVVSFDMIGCTTNELIAKGVTDGFLVKYIPMTKQITNNNITAPAQTDFCENGDPDEITGSQPDGAILVYKYQWEQSANGINFGPIANATEINYNPGVILQSTYFRRAVRSGICADVSYSNAVYFNVQIPSGTNIINYTGPTVACNSLDPAMISGNTVINGAYQWQMGTDTLNFVDIPGAILSTYDPPVLTRTVYIRRMVNTLNCGAPKYSKFVLFTVYANVGDNTISALNNVVCDASIPVVLTGKQPSGGDGAFTYQWQSSSNNANFTNITGATAKDYTPVLVKGTVFYRRVVTSAPCSTPSISDVANVYYPDAIDAQITPATAPVICIGGNVSLTATGGTTYKWSPAAGLSDPDIANPVASPSVTTNYTVTVSNGFCSQTKTITVKVVPRPLVNAGADAEIFAGLSAKLNGAVTASPDITYSWSPATYLSNPNSLTPIATPPHDITYTLTATTTNNCFTVSDDVFIRVYPKMLVPNSFTPNGDGMNDTWEIAALIAYPKCEVTVFAKNGARVFKSIGYNKPWDGKHNGKMLPFGTYYYTLDLKDGSKISSGWIAIIK